MRVVVTGAAGFIGTHLAQTLADQGNEVVAVDVRPTPAYPGIEAVMGDIRDVSLMSEATRGADVVYHQAAMVSVPQTFVEPAECMSVNVTGSAVVFEQARLAGVKRVVMASTSAIYGDDPTPVKHERLAPAPRSPYAVSKLAMEHLADVYARQYGMSMVALRYFNVYGPGQPAEGGYAAVIPAILKAIRTEQAMNVYGDGEQTRSFVHVADVVRANQLAAAMELPAEHPFLIANIVNPEVVSVNYLLDLFTEAADTEIGLNPHPERDGDIKHSAGDGTVATEVLGFEPEISLHKGIEGLVRMDSNRSL